MAKWRCTICGYIYDEDYIYDDKKNVRFEDLPSDWACPMCAASKSAFVLME
ncbi:MAG: rubredoxin [Candidatus Bathyarchaeia archaeon]